MALRFDASGDVLSRAAAVTVTTFSACGWCQVLADAGSLTPQTIMNATQTPGTDADVLLAWSTDADATTMALVLYDGSGIEVDNFASRPAVNDWFHWYVIVTGAGAGQAAAGWRRLTDASYVTVTGTLQTNSTGSVALRLADENSSGPLNCRMAAFKSWSVALTTAEMENERTTYAPRRTANLLQWAPMDMSTAANSALDFSGNGSNFTIGGTLAVEAGPPIAFRQGRRRMVIPVSAVTTLSPQVMRFI